MSARETYNNISLKELNAFPSYVFYDSAYPLANVYPWPVPAANIYEIHLTVKDLLPQFSSLSQVIVLPPEYYAALKFNLAVRLRQAYQLAPQPDLNVLAKDALNVIREANRRYRVCNWIRRWSGQEFTTYLAILPTKINPERKCHDFKEDRSRPPAR